MRILKDFWKAIVAMADEKNEMVNDNNNSKSENHPLAMYGCNDNWTFSKRDRSQEVYLSNNSKTAHFHPNWSKGTAGNIQFIDFLL